jgi:hypothetical protein
MNAMRRHILVVLGLLDIRFIWATIFSVWAPLKASGYFELLRQPSMRLCDRFASGLAAWCRARCDGSTFTSSHIP